jgi:hypothetical protein
MIDPFRLDELVDFPSLLVRILVFELIEVFVFKNLKCGEWWHRSFGLQLINLVFEALNECLILLT